MSLTVSEALEFLTNVLGLPTDVVDVLNINNISPSLRPQSSATHGDDRVTALQRLIGRFLAVEPYQSITLMAVDPSRRKRPEWPEIKTSMFLKQGGICYALNSFMLVLLKTIGFEVSLAHSTVPRAVWCPTLHVVVLVHSLVTLGDLFLVDVGLGYPIARAVPLDFEKESPVYVDSFHTYKLRRGSDDSDSDSQKEVISLIHMPLKTVQINESLNLNLSDIMVNDSNGVIDNSYKTILDEHRDVISDARSSSEVAGNEQFESFYFFDPTERHTSLEVFHPIFDVCYSDVKKLTFHTSPRTICFPFPGGKALAVLHFNLAIEGSEGDLIKFKIDGDRSKPYNDYCRKLPGLEIDRSRSDSTNDQTHNLGESFKSLCNTDGDSNPGESGHEHLENTGNGIQNQAGNSSQSDTGNTHSSQSENNLDFRPKTHLHPMEGELCETEESYYAKLVEAYSVLFPQFPRHTVVSALENWGRVEGLGVVPSFVR